MGKQAQGRPFRRLDLYQVLRRCTLTSSVAFVLLVPLWHVRSASAQSAGLAGTGRWVAMGELLHLPASAPPVVGAPWTVAVFGLEFLDPLAAVSVLAARGWDVKLLWGAIPTLLLLVVFGRFFCGWMCPYLPVLAASNALRDLLAKFRVEPRDSRLPDRSNLWVLGAVVVATATSGSQLVPLFYPPSVIGREVFRAMFFGGLSIGAAIVGTAFLFDAFVSRAGFCRYLCPGGAVFQLIGYVSPVRLKRVEKDCTDCALCDKACNLLQLPMTDVVSAGCERCGKCVAACPTDALKWTWGPPVLLSPPPRKETKP